MTDLLVDHHLDRGNISEVMRICKRESKANGRSNPELWSKVLTHMVARCELVTEQQATEALRRGSITRCSDEEELEEFHEELENFLTVIEDHQELAPYQVVGILCSNPSLPLSVAKRFITKFMRAAVDAIHDNEEKCASLHASTAHMSARIGELDTTSQSADAISAAARPGDAAPLSRSHIGAAPPSSVTGRGGRADPAALDPSLEGYKWEEMQRSMTNGASNYEANIRELEQSPDGFATVAGFFGQGLIR